MRLAVGHDKPLPPTSSARRRRDAAGVARVRDQAAMDSPVSHTLRKTVASFVDDSDVSIRKISDQLGHSRRASAKLICPLYE
jgi:integrase